MRRPAALALAVLFTPAIASAQDRAPDTDLPSCERAVADYVEDRTTGPEAQRDLGSSEYGEVLNNGTFLNRCGVPDSTKVVVCVAVQNGKAVGATVTTEPSSDDINRCVRNEVALLEYPSHPKMDLAKTTFAPADEDQKRGDAARPSRGDAQAEPPPPVAPKKSGCGCALPGFGDERAASVALAIGALVLMRRRRR